HPPIQCCIFRRCTIPHGFLRYSRRLARRTTLWPSLLRMRLAACGQARECAAHLRRLRARRRFPQIGLVLRVGFLWLALVLQCLSRHVVHQRIPLVRQLMGLSRRGQGTVVVARLDVGYAQQRQRHRVQRLHHQRLLQQVGGSREVALADQDARQIPVGIGVLIVQRNRALEGCPRLVRLVHSEIHHPQVVVGRVVFGEQGHCFFKLLRRLRKIVLLPRVHAFVERLARVVRHPQVGGRRNRWCIWLCGCCAGVGLRFHPHIDHAALVHLVNAHLLGCGPLQRTSRHP